MKITPSFYKIINWVYTVLGVHIFPDGKQLHEYRPFHFHTLYLSMSFSKEYCLLPVLSLLWLDVIFITILFNGLLYLNISKIFIGY